MVDLVMRFFSCGASLWRSSTRIRPKKGPAPWILFLTRVPRPLEVTFFGSKGVQPYFQQKNRLFCNWDALTQNSWIRPIMSYLWMIGLEMRFFSCGPTFEDYPQVFSQKKVHPLGLIFFYTCASASSNYFFWLVKLNMCVYTLLQGQLYFQQKNMCFAICARVDTKFLNSSHHVLSMDNWPGDAIFFLWGQPLKIIRKYSVKKGPAPWILFSCALASWSHFFWLVKVNICFCILLQSHVKNHTPSINYGIFFSWGLIFRYVLVNSHLIHPPLNSWLLTLGILQIYPLLELFRIDFLMP